MSGIYIHIPFCKQACHYCDFHFSVNLKKKDALLKAIADEIEMRKDEMSEAAIQSIYFGGGTPSLLTDSEIGGMLDVIGSNYTISSSPEITLEANPDDLDKRTLKGLKESGVNRLSIGIQSFFDEDLKLMNRAHDSQQALGCLDEAKKQFENISIDLIYGIPGMDIERWNSNLQTALQYDLPHISSYALTVEPRTALRAFIDKGIIEEVNDESAEEQFSMQNKILQNAGYVHYEISNFGKPDFFSFNNTSYWKGKPYLGIGPSAHSYDGVRRSWNIRNNAKYIKAIEGGSLPSDSEALSIRDQYNEYVMTGLRTIWGISAKNVLKRYGSLYSKFMVEQAQLYIDDGLLQLDGEVLTATDKGKFLVDGIASHLFMLNLEK